MAKKKISKKKEIKKTQETVELEERFVELRRRRIETDHDRWDIVWRLWVLANDCEKARNSRIKNQAMRLHDKLENEFHKQ